MKRYIYKGSQPHNSTIRIIDDGKPIQQDIMLSYGAEADLPDDHSVIKSMVDAGLLIEIPENKSSSKTK